MDFDTVTFALETDDIVGLTPDQRTAVELQMCVSIVDPGSQLYNNFEYPRYKGFYGYVQIMSGEHVVKAIALNYLNQEVLWWRDYVMGIIQTIGCDFKLYGSLDSPVVNFLPYSVKTRQRYTGVRVKLQPTVKANCEIKWLVAQPLCGDDVREPDPRQGEPPNGNNETYTPGDRPANQGGDNSDPSVNDGQYTPGSGDVPPPGDPSRSAQWHVVLNGFNDRCENYTFTYNTNVKDRNAKVTVSTEPSGAGAQCGHPDKRAILFVNGGVVGQIGTGGDLSVTAIYYS